MYICSACAETKRKCRCHRDKVVHHWTDDNGTQRRFVELLGPEFVWIRPEPPTEPDEKDVWVPFP